MISIIISILTILFLIMFIIFKPVIKLGKIEFQTFWIIPLVGASLLVLFKELDLIELKEMLLSDSAINPIKILVLFISVSFLSIVLDEAGFFKKCASIAIKLTNGSQMSLFLSISIVVSVLTIFTSNDIVILTFTPFICYFAKNAKISPIPYLIAEFVFANTWSMLLIIGNPTNIYLATSFNIDFWEYFEIMCVPATVTGLTAFMLLVLIFRKPLKVKMSEDATKIEEVVLNKKMAIIAGTHLGLCTILLAISSYIGLEMWLICLVFALSLIFFLIIYSIFKDSEILKQSLKRLPYNLIPFIISMFMIVAALNKTGVVSKISNIFDSFETNSNLAVLIEGISAFLSCNILNNIPMSVMYEKLIYSSNQMYMAEKIYSSIIASNVGAYLSPVGALAGIMWMGILKKTGLKFGFKDFMKYGIMLAPILVCVALFSLMIVIN